jgi:hypothetical protein
MNVAFGDSRGWENEFQSSRKSTIANGRAQSQVVKNVLDDVENWTNIELVRVMLRSGVKKWVGGVFGKRRL